VVEALEVWAEWEAWEVWEASKLEGGEKSIWILHVCAHFTLVLFTF